MRALHFKIAGLSFCFKGYFASNSTLLSVSRSSSYINRISVNSAIMLNYLIRRATPADAAAIAQHRVAMFRDIDPTIPDEMATALLNTSLVAVAATLQDGSYIGWLATTNTGQIIAGVGAHLKPQLPRFSDDRSRVITGVVPLVVNVYTEPSWRSQGIARALMTQLMQWATDEGFDRVLLHASDAGRPLYSSLGFTPTNEMRWSPIITLV